jgi:hypothetical protein
MFNITEHIDFDKNGRAVCPSCAMDGKDRNTNLALVPNTNGAYKCHRGCTPQEIRSALGAPKSEVIPTALAQTVAPRSVTVAPQKVREAHEKLMSQSSLAKTWLNQRGITDEMIARHQLGIVRAKSGDRHTRAISIPLPNDDGTAYYQKKRISPWLSEAEQPSGYKPWSQAGIPARVWFSNQAQTATQTWLCEGEWDAIMLGWAVRHSALENDVQVATFTAGAGNVPPKDQLDKLPGNVIIFYDRNDKPLKDGSRPGEEGAKKVAAALGACARIALVPMPDDCQVQGWDVSNALNHGYRIEDFARAAGEAATLPIESPKKENPLRSRLVTNAHLLATAPDYVEWLVPDLLPANELILLAAGPRAGKSLLAMLLAKSVATGEPFLDRPVTQGAVLYIRCEDAPVKIKQRQIAQGWEENLPVYWLDRFKLSQTAHLRELAEELDARLIVLDTLSRIRDDGATESSAEMSRVIEPLQEMAEDLNLSIVLVHHTGKVNIDNAGSVDVFETIRGSSAIRATCRGSMVIAADSESYRLCAENGYGKIDLKIKLDNTTLEWKLIGRWVEQVSSDLRSTVIDYLNQVGQATIEQIFDATQIPKNSLYKTLSRLVRDNMLSKSGHRRQVLYTRLIGLIGQSDSLSDDANADGDDDRGAYQTNNIFSFSDSRVISDQTGTCDTLVTSPQNGHFEEGGKKTPILSDKPSNIDSVSVSSSDKSSDKGDLSDEADLSDEEFGSNVAQFPLESGNKVKILTTEGWRRGIYNKPATGSYLSHSTGKLDASHWVTVRGSRIKVAESDIRRVE